MKAVLFDFGRVLANFNKEAACKVLAYSSPYSPEVILKQIIQSGLEKNLESGGITETVFANEVMFRCKIERLTVPDIVRVWGNILTPNPAIEPFVDKLIERKITTGVLSNTNGIHWPYASDLPVMLKLARYGAPLTLSYRVGALKPDPRIFKVALQKLKVNAADTLYIDDSEEHLVAAQKLGMHVEHYDSTRSDSSRLVRIFVKHKLA